MLTLPTELLVPLAFVVALILLSRLRADIRREHSEAFRYVAVGISILALTSLLKLYFRYGYLSNVPFLSEPLFHRMLVWVGVILGTVCVASGMSIWLQHKRTQRHRDNDTIRRLETLKKLVQLVAIESRPDQMLDRALGYIVEGFQLRYGAVYRLSAARNQLHLTAARPWGDFRVVHAAVQLDHAAWTYLQSGTAPHTTPFFDGFNPHLGKPSHVIPLLVDRRPVAFMIVWQNETPLDESSLLDLRIAADILARSFRHDLEVRKCRFFYDRDRFRAELRGELSAHASLTSNLSRLATALRRKLHCDLVSLTTVDRRAGRVRRYTWGPGGNPLIENGSISSLPESVAEALVASTGTIKHEGPSTQPHVAVISRNGSGAVLSISPVASRQIGNADRAMLRVAADVFAELLHRRQYRRLRLRLQSKSVQLEMLRARLAAGRSAERVSSSTRRIDDSVRTPHHVPADRTTEASLFEGTLP